MFNELGLVGFFLMLTVFSSHFYRAGKKNINIIFINEAIIYEYVPLERGNLKYLLKRNLRSGNGYILMNINLYKDNFIHLLILFVKSIMKILIYSFLLCLSFFSIKLFLKLIIKIYSTLGELFAFFNIKIRMYK